jgi:hypothetical protein
MILKDKLKQALKKRDRMVAYGCYSCSFQTQM